MKTTFKCDKNGDGFIGFEKCVDFKGFLPFCIQEVSEDTDEYHFKTKDDFAEYLIDWCFHTQTYNEDVMVCANGAKCTLNGYYEVIQKLYKLKLSIKDETMNIFYKAAEQIMIEELYSLGMRGA